MVFLSPPVNSIPFGYFPYHKISFFPVFGGFRRSRHYYHWILGLRISDLVNFRFRYDSISIYGKLIESMKSKIINENVFKLINNLIIIKSNNIHLIIFKL